MATLNVRANTFLATTNTTWTTTASAVDGAYGVLSATYGKWSSVVSGAVATIDVGFGSQLALPTAIGITNISVTLRHFESNTTRLANVQFQPYDGTTAIGSIFTATRATSARSDTQTFTPTLAQVRSANFKIRVTATRQAATQAGDFSIDFVDVVVTYTEPEVTPVASFTSSLTTVNQGSTVQFTDTSTNTPTTWAWNFGTGASPATASTKGPHTVTFNTAGTSTVNLTAGNGAGSDAADPTNITVNAVTKAETLTDEFTGSDGTTPNPTKWTRIGSSSYSVNRLACPVTLTLYSGVYSLNKYSLHESGVFVQATPPPTAFASRETILAVRNDAGDGAWLVVSGSPRTIMWRRRQASVNTDASRAYNPVTDLWLKIELLSGSLWFRTSPDGWTWTQLAGLISTTTDLSQATIELTHGQYTNNGAEDGWFDYFNVLPPVPVGGKPKVWSGSAWAEKPAKYWNGSSWVEKPMKHWDGDSWELV